MARKSVEDISGNKGISFEKAVAAIQKMVDPTANVAHNERIRDRHGHLRQFDVVIRTKVAGRRILGVIECKDLKKRVGTPEVDAFVTKARDVNANIALIVSRRGFTKPALEKAKDYGIGMLSLLPKDPQDCDFSVGMDWYVEIYRWAEVRFSVKLVTKHPPCSPIDSRKVTWCGWPVIDWFNKELVTKYLKERRQGMFSLTLIFDKTRRFHIASRIYLVKGITFYALRVCEYRSKWMQFSGEGLLDWNQQEVTMPAGKEIRSDWFRNDFSDWKVYQGELPPMSDLLDIRFHVYKTHFDPDREVVDLGGLCKKPLLEKWQSTPILQEQ